jgi:soluble cytochrome b562
MERQVKRDKAGTIGRIMFEQQTFAANEDQYMVDALDKRIKDTREAFEKAEEEKKKARENVRKGWFQNDHEVKFYRVGVLTFAASKQDLKAFAKKHKIKDLKEAANLMLKKYEREEGIT